MQGLNFIHISKKGPWDIEKPMDKNADNTEGENQALANEFSMKASVWWITLSWRWEIGKEIVAQRTQSKCWCCKE